MVHSSSCQTHCHFAFMIIRSIMKLHCMKLLSQAPVFAPPDIQTCSLLRQLDAMTENSFCFHVAYISVSPPLAGKHIVQTPVAWLSSAGKYAVAAVAWHATSSAWAVQTGFTHAHTQLLQLLQTARCVGGIGAPGALRVAVLAKYHT